MRLTVKLTLGLIVIGTALSTMGYLSLSQLDRLNEPLSETLPNTINSLSRQITLFSLSDDIKYYDEILTQSARNYAFTQDTLWKERYLKTEPLLDKIITQAIEIGGNIEDKFLTNIDDANKKLVSMEHTALKLVDDGNFSEAISILESEDYALQKSIYTTELNSYVEARGRAHDSAHLASLDALDVISLKTQNLIFEIQETAIFIIILTIVLGVGLSMILLISIIYPIQRLKTYADKISSGSKNIRIPVSGDAEIKELTESINNMVNSLTESETQTQESEIRYKSLFENSPHFVNTIDLGGKITDCNQRMVDFFGYSKEELIGLSEFDLVAKESKNEAKKAFEQLKALGELSNLTLICQKRDGTTFPCLINITSLKNKSHETIGFLIVFLDITELSLAKKEIETLQVKRLSTIGELTARIAHDLRNPLSVIKNSVEILRITNENKIDEKQHEQWKRLERAIDRMSHQVEDVLDYVRSPPLRLSENSLSVIIQDAIDRVSVPKNVTIHPPPTDFVVFCDPEKLDVVIVNLLMNAIQAVHAKPCEINISIKDDIQNDNVLIEFTDNGPGIPSEIIDDIFEPLFTTRQIGTGLGLPSCRNIMERHGGSIRVSSIVGKETTFTLTLPKKSQQVIPANKIHWN